MGLLSAHLARGGGGWAWRRLASGPWAGRSWAGPTGALGGGPAWPVGALGLPRPTGGGCWWLGSPAGHQGRGRGGRCAGLAASGGGGGIPPDPLGGGGAWGGAASSSARPAP